MPKLIRRLLAIGLVLLCAGSLNGWLNSRRSQREQRIRQFLRIPEDAQILVIREHEQMLGSRTVVSFKLPHIKPAELRVEELARECFGMNRKNRRTEYLYEGGGDYCRVEYKPELDLYECEYRWD